MSMGAARAPDGRRVDVWPSLDRPGLVDGLREEMPEALVAGNEDPAGLLIGTRCRLADRVRRG